MKTIIAFAIIERVKKKVITICSSASFYKDVVATAEKLRKLGFVVKIPKTASKMKRAGNFNVSYYKTWLKDKNLYHLKRKLMKEHIEKVLAADAILVYNSKKNGIRGYIGGNGLIEMFVAYQNRKPIFVWEETGENSMLIEEILGMNPIFINHDLSKIKLK